MEHIVIIIRIEKRLKVDNIDTMSKVIAEEEMEFDFPDIVIHKISNLLVRAMLIPFSFINKGNN